VKPRAQAGSIGVGGLSKIPEGGSRPLRLVTSDPAPATALGEAVPPGRLGGQTRPLLDRSG